MHNIKRFLQPFTIRQNLILLGVLLIAITTVATTYLALQPQELRKQAAPQRDPACIQVCNNEYFNVCTANCSAGIFPGQCQGTADDFGCCINDCNFQFDQCEAGCPFVPTFCDGNGQCNPELGEDSSNCPNECVGGGTPNCDSTPQCSGFCSWNGIVDTCSNNGSQDNCVYTTSSSGGTCNQVAAPNQQCSVDQCAAGKQCIGGNCTGQQQGCVGSPNGVCEAGEPLDNNICSDCPTAQETQCSQTRDNNLECWFDSDCLGDICNQSSCTCVPVVQQCSGGLSWPNSCNPSTLVASWNVTDVFGQCFVYIRDPAGAYHIVNNGICGEANNQTITALDGAPITNGQYQLRISNGADACFNQDIGTPVTVNCQATATFAISGKVFVDTDGDGQFDSGEAGRASVAVALSGAASKTASSNTSGDYSFANLSAGDYTVAITLPSGFRATSANPENISGLSADRTVNFGISSSTTTQPDLIATQPSRSPTSPTVGQAVTFTSTIRNQSGTAISFQLITNRFCIDNPNCAASTAGRIGADVAFNGSLAANATSSTITSLQWTAEAGSHTVHFCADVAETITESNENNNCSSVTFTVGAAATTTPVPTATKTPTLPPGVTATKTPTPTLPPGVTATRTPTGGVTGLPTGGPTLGPNDTGLLLSLTLEGFPGTRTPTRKTEPITIELRSETASISARGTLTYSEVARRFEGLLNLGGAIGDGVYRVFVKASSYLRRDLGTITIQSQTVNNVLEVSPDKPLLSCDFNNDNIVNILDINQVYTDIRNANVKDSLADIDRDGKVSIFDHNFCVQNFLEKGD